MRIKWLKARKSRIKHGVSLHDSGFADRFLNMALKI
jgi:hypothetical protein